MNGAIRDYARIGLVHHLLYPQTMNVPDRHVETLLGMLRWDTIETIDCCLPFEPHHRETVRDAAARSGKEIVYAMHLVPAAKLAPAATAHVEQALVRYVMTDQIAAASMLGASGFVFVSGADTPGNREPGRQAFRDFCEWFGRELGRHGIDGLLEPFDRTVDKKYLYGPTSECMALLDSLSPEAANIGIELDIAHLPLMGENIDEAIRTVAGKLKRVHVGNCVLKDKQHPFYGDKHPPVGIEGGEIDADEMALALSTLLEVGYLDKASRGALVMEMQPYPGLTAEETVRYSFDKLDQAWRMV